MKTICINNKNKPNEIPFSHWIKEGAEYTIIEIVWMEAQKHYGVQIEEIDLRSFYPWKYFDARRFALSQDDINKWFNIEEEPKEEEVFEEMEEEIFV